MAENIIIDKNLSKEEIYINLVPQIESLISGETDLIANLANITSAIYFSFDFLWVGFYLCKDEELVLGPFHGPVACTRIKKGKGVCGTAWQKNEPIIVADVELFDGHISCSSDSRSEIVIPLSLNNEVKMVLDIDSSKLNTFDLIDLKYLSKILSSIFQ